MEYYTSSQFQKGVHLKVIMLNNVCNCMKRYDLYIIIFIIFVFLEMLNFEFDRIDLLCLAVSSVFGVWYFWKKVRHVVFQHQQNTIIQREKDNDIYSHLSG